MKNHSKTILCQDGFSMSVQAGTRHYSSPRNDTGPYSAVEIGFPSHREALILEFAESPDSPTETVYGWVPTQKVWDVILKHGGVVSGELPPLVMSGE
tara:strand:- start:630 stop:920 length:291 start_codon:yes stop_codon:yes gene_type:complete